MYKILNQNFNTENLKVTWTGVMQYIFPLVQMKQARQLRRTGAIDAPHAKSYRRVSQR